MLKNSDSSIGTKECCAIIIIMLFMKITDGTATNFFKSCYTSGWIVPLVSMMIICVSLLCIFMVLKRYEGKGLIEIIFMLTGKLGGLLIGTILFTTSIIMLTVNLREHITLINMIFFPRTSLLTITIPMIVISCYIASLGLKAIARSSLIILPYIEFSIVLLIIFSLPFITPNFLFPIAGHGIKYILESSIKNINIFQFLIILPVCFPMFRNRKSFKNATFIGLFIGVLQLCILCAFFQMAFDYPAIVIVSYPFYLLTRLIKVGRFITNMEPIFFLCMVISSAIYYSLHIYVTTAVLTYTTSLGKIEKAVYLIGTLVTLLSLIPENPIPDMDSFLAVFLPIVNAILFFLPISLLAISQIKGDYAK